MKKKSLERRKLLKLKRSEVRTLTQTEVQQVDGAAGTEPGAYSQCCVSWGC